MTAKGKKGSNRRGPYAPRDPFPPDPRCFQQYLIRARSGQAAVEIKGVKKVEAERVEAIRNLLFLRYNARLTGVEALQLNMLFSDLMIEAAACPNQRERWRDLSARLQNAGGHTRTRTVIS